MPMPKPKDGESKKDFLDRCMGNPTMNEDYPDNDQRYAICNDLWDNKKSESNNDIEVRTFRAEIRTEGDNPQIKGTAAVFGVEAESSWGFKEVIHPDSFGDIIKTNDVFALINHDPNLVLGRNTSGTLSLEENEKGLDFVVDPPDTTFANDLVVSMGRKDIDKCSFAFIVADEWWEKKDETDIRHITKFKELFDVSIVTYPAFKQTSAQLFGKDVKAPEKVYAEYRSKISQDSEAKKLKEEEQEKRNIQAKEYRDRLLDLI